MSSQPAIHPSNIMKGEWVLSSQTLHAGGLIVEHQIEPPAEAEAPGGLTHHLLALQLSDGTRQVSRIDGREYDGPLLQGEMLLIPAEVPLFGAWETTDESLIFIIDPTFIRRIALETNCLNPDQIELISVLKTHDPQIASIALSMQNEMQQKRWGSRLYLDSLANILAIHLLRNYISRPGKFREYTGGLTYFKLRQVLDYISVHLEQDIKLTDLAEIADISQCYFALLFKQSMGVTPWQYVMQQRIERAKDLLKQRDRSIANIAFLCGFSSQSHFTQQFRKLTGVTPKKYRDISLHP
ncbi:AraC family transcriptional regulator [Fischerella sp. PCC 9605]|uniref:AraC family transcriptional regulator n=1 Tax=Fischerella sp. PCC 9605 TaxID=1173024 RepID=UPI000479611A|nr:AraC family transcriptional regulator [Fischerella sp. PCC 9605]